MSPTPLELMTPTPSARGRRRVLVVDDDKDIRMLLRTFLATEGYHVLTAEDGEEALRVVANAGTELDLVLLDVRMPNLNGLEVCKRLRADPQYARLPIIFLTAEGREGELELQGLEAGGDEFLHKPVTRRMLCARVKNLIRLADTERERHLMAQTAHHEKLATIGQVAAGVAHELNNPLAFVLSNLETMKGYFTDLFEVLDAWHQGPEQGRKAEAAVGLEGILADAKPLVDETVEGGRRVRAIVQELKTFARPDTDKQEMVDLADVVKSTLLLTEREVLRVATFTKTLQPAVIELASRARLHQLMLNMMVNAMHACEARPLGPGEKHRISVATRVEGDDAVLELSDTGCGIPQENLQRIFTPFFTTKPVGIGTGMGLSVCTMVVQKLGGRIGVKSTVGEGTTFTIVIPRRHVDAPSGPQTITSSAA